MNVFSQLQQAVITRLTATVADAPSPTPANGEITWITEDIGDLKNAIDRTVAKLGLVGIVLTPGGGRMFELDHDFPIAFICPIIIQVQENVIINRGSTGTQISSLDLVQFCMKRLHRWSPTHQRINKITLAEEPFVMVVEAPILTYNVLFNSQLTIQ